MSNPETVFKALSHEKRLKIMEWLKDPVSNFPPQTEGDLVEDGVCVLLIAGKLGVSQPTATQHLKLLQDAGLIRSRRIGKWTFISRDEQKISELKSIMENF